jgi:uncharacterized membrane protein
MRVPKFARHHGKLALFSSFSPTAKGGKCSVSLTKKAANPMLWGVMATILNFVPYLGTMVGIATVAAPSEYNG